MKSRERMLDEAIEAKDKEIQRLKGRVAELTLLIKTIADAIEIQMEGGDGDCMEIYRREQ